ncbi:MAG TPA: FecR domain-containing protein [Bryobacteraceae bacterium]
MLKDYREPEDLLSDESFLSWYFSQDRPANSDWTRWMTEAPGREQLVRDAISLLESTVIEEKELPASQLERAEAALMQKMGAEPAASLRSSLSVWRWVAAASVIVVLAGAMVVMRIRSGGQKVLITPYGQLMVRQLPDGSEVTINANSRIRFANNWKDGGEREVWLEGEAFFHVRRTPDGSRFIVHADRFDVIVTGTQFNVVSRRHNANVMLREGSVTLRGRDGQQLNMAPGDFVQWDGKTLSRREAQRDSVLAWKDRRLFFDKTPLKDVANIIEDQYGIKVQLSDPSLGDSTITGIMPNNNLEVLLQALQATKDFDVTRGEGSIQIKAPAH